MATSLFREEVLRAHTAQHLGTIRIGHPPRHTFVAAVALVLAGALWWWISRQAAAAPLAVSAPAASLAGNSGKAADPDQVAVDGEWRKIEAERIAEEQAEAREDLLDAEPARRRWPWLALAVALAAGLIAAALINSAAVVSRPPVAQPPEAPAE